MDWWNLHFKVGVVVLVSFILFAFLLLSTSNSPWSASGDILEVHFDFINDLRVGSDVQISGVSVGKVTSIELLSDASKVKIKFSVENGYSRLRKNLQVRIGTIGFVGEAYILLTNSEVSNSYLTEMDMPLTGVNPVGLESILSKAEGLTNDLTQIAQNINQIVESNKTVVSESIIQLQELIAKANGVLDQLENTSRHTVAGLDDLVDDVSRETQKTFAKLNYHLDQISKDISNVTENAARVTHDVAHLVGQNTDPIQSAVSELQIAASQFRQSGKQINRDAADLMGQLSELITKSQNVIEVETPKLDHLLERVTISTENFDQLSNNLVQVVQKVKEGDGSIAQLLNKPDVFGDARGILRNANKTLTSLQGLSQELTNQSNKIKLPRVTWDYELRYLDSTRYLYNEIAGLWLPTTRSRLRLGLGTREGDTKLEFQYGYNLASYLRGRLGFMRSKPGIGIDLMLVQKSLGLSFEVGQITGSSLDLDSEIFWRVLPNAHLVIGVENLASKIHYTAGFRLAGKKW